MRYGLSEHDVNRIIQRELETNPDLTYYINNPYFDEFVALLINGIGKVIEQNNKKVIDDINREIKMNKRSGRF